jgi:hypothetical protein
VAQQPDQSDEPQFAWVPQKTGVAKLFMASKERQAFAEGTSRRMLVYAWGFRWINGDIDVRVRWEELAYVWQGSTRHYTRGAHTNTDYSYKLQLTDGRAWGFSGTLFTREDLKSRKKELKPSPGVTTPVTVEQAGRLLEMGVTRVQLPLAMQRFRAGQAVSFGPLTVSQHGIAAGDQSLPWSEVQEVRTWNGVVSVKKAGKWLSWNKALVSQIANYFVFDAMVRAIIAEKGAAPGRG